MKLSKETIGLAVILSAIITNPITGQYVLQVLDWSFEKFFKYGSWVTLVAGIYATGLIIFYMYQSREITKIPKKGTKTLKAGRLIET